MCHIWFPPLLADYVIISVLSQTGSSACLKKAFCKTCVTIALRNPDDFILDKQKKVSIAKNFTVYRQNGQSVKIHLARLISYLVPSMYLHPASGFYSQSVSASVNFTFKTASRSINAGIKLSRINRSIFQHRKTSSVAFFPIIIK